MIVIQTNLAPDTVNKLNQAMNIERAKMRDPITNSSKLTTPHVPETYQIDEMGVDFSPDSQELIDAGRVCTAKLGQGIETESGSGQHDQRGVAQCWLTTNYDRT